MPFLHIRFIAFWTQNLLYKFIKESQLAGLDDNAIMRYFTRQEDGTYIINEANITADFPEAKYGKIDTPEKLKKTL